MKTLRDLGEREVIKQIIARYCHADIGDDCAEVKRSAETIIVTTDPVPPPAAEVIAGDADPYWKGRLLTTINASDLAAAAAEPVAFFVAAEAPADLPVESFHRFFEGVADACREEGMIYAGGNIREGQQLSAVGTAIGARPNDNELNRRGVKEGDLFAIVGNGGVFWMDALRSKAGNISINKKTSPLFTPHSESTGMRLLFEQGLIIAAMDNSDGLLPTIEQLASINNIGAVLDLEQLTPPLGYNDVQETIKIAHQRLWLGWGDWNVVVGIKQEDKTNVIKFAQEKSIPVTICGKFISDSPGVQLKYKDEISNAPRLDSERFAKDSWFSAGIDGYIEQLRTVPLPGGL